MLKKRLATLSISALLGLGLLAGCGEKEQGDTSVDSKDVPVSHESQEPASSYTVTFFVGSEEYDVQTVTSGSYASKPATDPVKEADQDFTYVFDGWYESGAETAWNFETNSITKDLNLFAKFTSTPIEQDLIIWVWGGTDENIYITEEEFVRLETEGSKIAALEGKKVAWRYKFGMGNSAFNEEATSSLVRPDLLISGNNLYKDGVGVPLAEADGYGQIKLGTGWFTNTSRYMGIAETTSASHFPLATAVYDLLKENGPDYFALDHAAVTVKPGATKTVSASYAEGETRKVAFKSADETIATVTEEGVITGVGEGKTFITATLGLVSQEVEVVVDATDYKLVAYVNAGKSGDKITEEESNRIKDLAQEMVGADQPISWNYIAKADDFGLFLWSIKFVITNQRSHLMSEKKYHIENNSVQETLIIPLYARAYAAECYPSLIQDPTAKKIIDQLDYDFSTKGKKLRSFFGRYGALEVAQREYDLEWEVKDYLKSHPQAAVVNMGCGLDDLFSRVNNGVCQGYNLDFPDVIAIRNEILPPLENEKNIPCDLNDFSWFEQIEKGRGVVFVAAGVFYYFTVEKVKDLFVAMSRAFPGGVLAFDTANKRALKAMLKTWIKDAEIQNVNAYFGLSKPETELSSWSDNFETVSHRSYMKGYRKLKKINPIYHFANCLMDSLFKMNIVKISFIDNKSSKH